MGKKDFKAGLNRFFDDEAPKPKGKTKATNEPPKDVVKELGLEPIELSIEPLDASGLLAKIGSAAADVIDDDRKQQSAKRGRPKSNFREIDRSSQEGCKANETRATFIVKEDALEKIKALAYWERRKVKEVIQAALAEHLDRYERANGPIKPKPE